MPSPRSSALLTIVALISCAGPLVSSASAKSDTWLTCAPGGAVVATQHPHRCELHKRNGFAAEMFRLRWHRWGHDHAKARGRAHAVGSGTSERVRVVAYRKRHLGTSSWWYTRVRLRHGSATTTFRTGTPD